MSVVSHPSNNFMPVLEPKAILTHMKPIHSFTPSYLLYLGFTFMLPSHLFLVFTASCFFQLFRLTYCERICYLTLFVSRSTGGDTSLLVYSSSSLSK
jgi:hypothetical protein